jgi:hypothetical protein
MTAVYQNAANIKSYTPEVDLVSTVVADNVNSLQVEVTAIESVLGSAATNQSPLISTYAGTFARTTGWSTVADRLANIEAGLVSGVSGGAYVTVTGGSTITTNSNKGLVLTTNSGTSNLLETYSSANALGFNVSASGIPAVGTGNVLYVNGPDYNTLTASIASAVTLANTKVPLSTVSSAGDLIIGTGSATVTKLSAGTSGQALIINSGGSVVWGTPTDTTKVPLSTFTTNGDLVVGTGNGTITKLGIGSTGQVLTSTNTGLAWQTPTTYLATANASVTAASTSQGVVRNVWVSTSAPTSGQGADGDIWIVYA